MLMDEPGSSRCVMYDSKELQCVGKLEIVRPKPLGFLCGSIPVPTDKAILPVFSEALVPSTQIFGAPLYKELPPSTDLNALPFVKSFPEKNLAVDASRSNTSGETHWSGEAMSANLEKKCEELAVSGFVDYDDEIDVIAPTDILKQIFKMPYTKSGLSVAVRRVGNTLILNKGPDVDEGEKLYRRRGTSTKSKDHSLFLTFAMHSVRMEACDCPPSHQKSSAEVYEDDRYTRETTNHAVGKFQNAVKDNSSNNSDYSSATQDGFLVGRKSAKRDMVSHPVPKSEKPRNSMQESEAHHNEFRRVFFWQFHNFRMLLGSDMLIFSNEKHVAVSLHLWDITHEVSPVTWLEAWLDNVMANVPEIAICYHQSGVVHRYELLKTDEILRVAISDDGFPAFNPYIVQQNGLSVLRFLQENCKREPGAYWLYKNSGDEVLQLFDFSNLPKCSSEDSETSESSLPYIFNRSRSDSLLNLGTLLYRIANRLSHSVSPNKHAVCAKYFRQCLELLDDPDYLVHQAFAHEQFARFLLNYHEDLEFSYKSLPLEYESTVSLESLNSSEQNDLGSSLLTCSVEEEDSSHVDSSNSMIREENETRGFLFSSPNEIDDGTSTDEVLALSNSTPSSAPLYKDTVSSKLAAVHHVSQAIKSLRYMRKTQNTDDMERNISENSNLMDSLICACGDSACIEVCDIWEWLPTSKIDHKLWTLIFLLGESYLALAEEYKNDRLLHEAMKIVDFACSIYGSMPSHFGDAGNNASDNFTYVFWGKAWTLVGDIYVEFLIYHSKELSIQAEKRSTSGALRLSAEIVNEVHRLKNKLSDYSQNCASCSLANCSCQSDRASSGNSASSSSSNMDFIPMGRKQGKRSHTKNSSLSCQTLQPEISSEETNEFERHPIEEKQEIVGESLIKKPLVSKKKGIFRYIREFPKGDIENILNSAASCYKEAQKVMNKNLTSSSEDLESIVKKIGWVYNELGRHYLQRKELVKAEDALGVAVDAFRRASDFHNIVLVYCNLGHGRRSLAEEMASSVDPIKSHATWQGLAKSEYSEAIRYYALARLELNSVKEDDCTLREEVYTQYAHTYLRLGMLLAREGGTAKLYESASMEEDFARSLSLNKRRKKGARMVEIAANDAIREALSVYESLGNARRQEAAYAYFQLACFQRDCCLKFLESKGGNVDNSLHQRAKQYSSLAERSWQKASDFYGPNTHPSMFLSIIIERAELLMTLSAALRANSMLESAVCCLLEGRHVSSEQNGSVLMGKLWRELQGLLKRMVSTVHSASQKAPSSWDSGKLKDLYKLSLTSNDLNVLHSLWPAS